jgi:hypothetical protein
MIIGLLYDNVAIMSGDMLSVWPSSVHNLKGGL